MEIYCNICYNYDNIMKKMLRKRAKHPTFRPSLFWDVDPKTIDPVRHARYIIERVLDFGNDREVRWLWRAYNHTLIHDVVKKSRVLHPQSRSLWTLLTHAK